MTSTAACNTHRLLEHRGKTAENDGAEQHGACMHFEHPHACPPLAGGAVDGVAAGLHGAAAARGAGRAQARGVRKRPTTQ